MHAEQYTCTSDHVQVNKTIILNMHDELLYNHAP